MSAEEGSELPLTPHVVSTDDPWLHEHGEGDRGESVPLHQPNRPETGAHLIGEPVKIHSSHRRSVIAILMTAAVVAAVTAVIVMERV